MDAEAVVEEEARRVEVVEVTDKWDAGMST